MYAKFLLLLLLMSDCYAGYSQASLIGNWRRVNQTIKNQDFNSKQAQIGDLTIRVDSTFFIQGDTSLQLSATAGWRYGNEYKGTWQQRSKTSLWFLMENDIFYPFIIVSLTSTKLVLRLTFSKKLKKYNWVYVRM